MMKKWIAINLLLLAVAAVIGWQLRQSILRFNADNDVGKIVPVQDMKQRILPEKPAATTASTVIYNPAEFGVIAEKNLFAETRTKEEKVEVTAPPEPPPLTNKPILVGIVIVDTNKTASIIEPGSGQPRGAVSNRAQTKRIGDVYQGYTITDIAADHIVLESGTRKEIIPLREGLKRTGGGKTPVLATRVVPFGGGSGIGAVASVGTPVPVRTVVTPAVSPAAPSSTQAPGVQVTAPARGVQTATPTPRAQPAPTAPASGSGSGSGTSAPPGTRILKTPFGDVIRPAR